MIRKAALLMLSAFIPAGLPAAQSGNPLAADRWSGTYQSAELQVELAKNAGQYAGKVIFNGQTLPLTATVKDNGLEGVFALGEQKFAFRAEGGGDTLTFVTDGVRYVLQKQGAPKPAANPPTANPPAAGIVGEWQSPKLIIRMGADGTGTIAGTACRYVVRNNVITFSGTDGNFDIPFVLSGDTLTLTLAGQPTRFARITAEQRQAAGGSHPPELAGKWCYQANVNATNGGARNSSICVVLNADGTYTYHGLADSYNPYGGATTQVDDAGTWTATENTLSVVSRLRGPITYSLEKRNHPKNHDPMLILDGRAFVTFYQKAPWQ